MSTPTSQQYFKTFFLHLNLDWELILIPYLLPGILTKNTSLRTFQYKVLNNVLYLNFKLFQFDETIQQLSYNCNEVTSLWTEIKLHFANDIKPIALCPKIAF